MATTILHVLFLSVLLRATISLPISRDVKSVQSDSAQDVELSGRTLLFGLDTMLRRDDNTEQVDSLDSEPFNEREKRTKRETIVGNHSCAEGMLWLVYRCVTSENYDELKQDDDYDIEAIQSTEKTVVFDPGTNLNRGESTEPTSSTIDVDTSNNRNEYKTVEVNETCVQGMVWLEYRCVTLEMYKQLTENNNNKTSVQASQNNAAPRLQMFHLIPVVLLAISFQ